MHHLVHHATQRPNVARRVVCLTWKGIVDLCLPNEPCRSFAYLAALLRSESSCVRTKMSETSFLRLFLSLYTACHHCSCALYREVYRFRGNPIASLCVSTIADNRQVATQKSSLREDDCVPESADIWIHSRITDARTPRPILGSFRLLSRRNGFDSDLTDSQIDSRRLLGYPHSTLIRTPQQFRRHRPECSAICLSSPGYFQSRVVFRNHMARDSEVAQLVVAPVRAVEVSMRMPRPQNILRLHVTMDNGETIQEEERLQHLQKELTDLVFRGTMLRRRDALRTCRT
jgi:hypothetical protein